MKKILSEIPTIPYLIFAVMCLLTMAVFMRAFVISTQDDSIYSRDGIEQTK